MRRVLAVSAALLAACATGPSLTLSPQPADDPACAPPPAPVSAARIAVLPFASSRERRTEAYLPPPAARLPPRPYYQYLPDDGDAASRAVEGALAAKRPSRVVERRELERIIAEQRLQVTGLVDPREAARLGRLAGADAVLLGTVEHAYAGYENVTAAAEGSWVGTYVPHAALDMRLVSVETGGMLWGCRLSRSALSYLKEPLTLTTRGALRDPHGYDAPLFGATADERVHGLLRAAARDAVARLDAR